MWVLDFFLERPQQLRVNGCLPDSTGLPQGCVLFHCCLSCNSCIQSNCRSCREQIFRRFVVVVEDTAVISLLSGDQDGHGAVVYDFVNWCDELQLRVNVSQAKYLSNDFRRNGVQPQPAIIRIGTVESVHHFE